MVRSENRRAEALVGVISMLALGLSLGSSWSARGSEVFGGALSPSFEQVVAVVGLAGLALAAARTTVRHRTLAFAACAFAAVRILAVWASTLMEGAAEAFALSIVTACFGGASVACVLFVALTSLASLPPRRAALLVSLGFLVANLYDAFFLDAGPGPATVQWLVTGAVSSILALYPALVSGPQPPVRRGSGLALGPGLFVFCASVAALMCIQGALAHATGFGAAGSHAFFGMSSEILMVALRIAVLPIAVGLAGRANLPVVVAGSSALWAAGLFIVVVFPLGNSLSDCPGMLVVESGMYILQVLACCAAVTGSRQSPERTEAGVALVAAAVLANQLTRCLPLLFAGTPEEASVPVTASAGLLAVALVLAANIVALTRRPSAPRSPADPTGQPGGDATNASPIHREERAFALRFEALCAHQKLPDREREVLFYALHGYTLDSIADKLGVSRETVKTYVGRAYRRCGVGGRQELIATMEELDVDSL